MELKKRIIDSKKGQFAAGSIGIIAGLVKLADLPPSTAAICITVITCVALLAWLIQETEDARKQS